MKNAIQSLLISVLSEMGITDVVPDVTIAEDSRFGEYTTNVALKLAKSLKKSPMDIALQVKELIEKQKM